VKPLWYTVILPSKALLDIKDLHPVHSPLAYLHQLPDTGFPTSDPFHNLCYLGRVISISTEVAYANGIQGSALIYSIDIVTDSPWTTETLEG